MTGGGAMAYGKPEKLAPRERGAYKRWVKWVSTKRFRLNWRRLGEDAPMKREYFGWTI
jgi:hypothetical protein